MKSLLTLGLIMATAICSTRAQTSNLNLPILEEFNFFEEKNGVVAVEAEYYFKQSKTEQRQWYRYNKHESPNLGKHANYSGDTSNNGYIKILPDTRVTHDDKLIRGENFSNVPGKLAVLHYRIKINTPGRYYVWARVHSTGSEDNGVHVGLNGDWPENGQRMQWCDGKNNWTWTSKQRTKEVHCGVPHEIYLDIPTAGYHNIQFSMREDGFAMDKFVLTRDKDFVPTEKGPRVRIQWPEPSYYEIISTSVMTNKTLPVADFPVEGTGYYKDAGGRWFGVNPNHNKEASSTTEFTFESGTYDVVFAGVGEHDGQSKFTVLINEEPLGTFRPALTQKWFVEGKSANKVWEKVQLSQGDKITVRSQIGSKDGKEWARARWSGLIFAPVGKGKIVANAPGVLPVDSNEGPTINPPKGRIAVVADGNSPDPDDLGGTAVSIALLSASGLQDRLVHYSHSCDLERVDRISEKAERERHALMQAACDVTARRWGGYDDLTFFDAKWQQKETVADLAKAIDASTDNDPLWIIEAGEPDIIGLALEASNKAKHKYVKVVTHHPANDDAGDFYTWQQILDFGVEEVRIPDQNVNLKVNLDKWDWAKNHPDPRIQWVWLQGKIAEVDDVVRFQKGKWDCSDAGMVLYWITGATNGGLQLGTVDQVKRLLLDHVEK